MKDGYFQSTRHPWPCLLFLMPLLLAYEGGVMWLSEAQGEALRTGTDSWLRWVLQEFGLGAMCFPPIIIGAIFIIWNSLRLADRPRDAMGIWLGMAVESVAFALVLWGLGRLQDPLLEKAGIMQAGANGATPRLAQAISFLGAGIYEELLFRLLLFPLLLKLFSITEMSTLLALGLAMAASSVIFSTAHHVGPFGEPYDPRVFLFRTLAGMYFAMIFQFRGFGIAVGTHACYDVLVGVAMA
jgi:membrane protease YdiL (CAAX protease family)